MSVRHRVEATESVGPRLRGGAPWQGRSAAYRNPAANEAENRRPHGRGPVGAKRLCLAGAGLSRSFARAHRPPAAPANPSAPLSRYAPCGVFRQARLSRTLLGTASWERARRGVRMIPDAGSPAFRAGGAARVVHGLAESSRPSRGTAPLSSGGAGESIRARIEARALRGLLGSRPRPVPVRPARRVRRGRRGS